MTLGRRITWLVTTGVSFVLFVVAIVLYFSIRQQANARVVDSLQKQLPALRQLLQPASLLAPGAKRNALLGSLGTKYASLFPGLDAEIVTAQGSVVHLGRVGLTLPLVSTAAAVAQGKHQPFVSRVQIASANMIVLTARGNPGEALVLGTSTESNDRFLHAVVQTLLASIIAAVLLTFGVCSVAVAGALKPLKRLSQTVTAVASTKDLSRRLPVNGKDELSLVASEFNSMMAALQQSRLSQKQLVADASHELRTPLTSIRTNLEVMMAQPGLDPGERREIDGEIIAQIQELDLLISDLADLARDEPPRPVIQVTNLASLASQAVERSSRRSHSVHILSEFEDLKCLGDEATLRRAVSNLIDNAVAWSPAGAAVEVALFQQSGDAVLTVRDHGPGIAPSDLPFVFDRFYRSRSARRLPGSGLGLAIVRQVATWHGGSAGAENATDGGAIVWMRLPLSVHVDRDVRTRSGLPHQT